MLKLKSKKFWTWQTGRQESGYDKLLLLTGYFPWPFDCYLLKFKEGSTIPPHQDKVLIGRHYRLNIILKAAKVGGEFQCEKIIFQSKRIKLFRPDENIHSVTRLEKGTRWVLSLGWVLGGGKIKPAS